MKGMYHYIREAWHKPEKRQLSGWRKTNAIIRVEKPLRLDRARSLGFKAKPGFVIARVRIRRGGRKRPRRKKGRRTKRQTIRKTLKMNYRWVAEQRAARKLGLEVLNSYWLAKDGMYYWYEIILINPKNPHIIADKNINWICKQRGRVFRGLTSAAKKSRGLRKKGKRRGFKT